MYHHRAMWRRVQTRKAPSSPRFLSKSSSLGSQVNSLAVDHSKFLKDVAKIDVPSRLPVLLEVFRLQGMELIAPDKRSGLNPFFIPIAKNNQTGNHMGFLRWPTQKKGMDLQLVTTTEAGIKLVALSTDHFVTRMAAESDFYQRDDASHLESLVNEYGKLYTKGDSLSLLKSGRFPAGTDKEKRLVLDRYLLTKVGSFPEGYERIAEDFCEKRNDVSALVTCERCSNVFYGWGHPNTFHALMLLKMNREHEANDTARSSLAMPKWTLANTIEELDHIIKMTGFTDRKVVGDMHRIRANDPRQKDIDEGVTPVQISLDQAAHIMDAVALGAIEGGWDAVRGEIASKYREGYPEMASFIETTN